MLFRSIGQYYLVDYLNAGIVWPRPGARNQNLCAIGEYRCSDGFIGLCVYGVPQNKYLLETIGLGHLWGSGDYPEDCSALWLSSSHAAQIEAALEAWLATRTVAEVEADFAAHRIAHHIHERTRRELWQMTQESQQPVVPGRIHDARRGTKGGDEGHQLLEGHATALP